MNRQEQEKDLERYIINEENLEKYIKKMQNYKKEVSENDELSFNLLVNAGILNSNGQIASQYK